MPLTLALSRVKGREFNEVLSLAAISGSKLSSELAASPNPYRDTEEYTHADYEAIIAPFFR